MTTLLLPVSEAAAQRFEALSDEQKQLVSQLVDDCLEPSADLLDVMNYLSFQTERRGLTPEILDELLTKECE